MAVVRLESKIKSHSANKSYKSKKPYPFLNEKKTWWEKVKMLLFPSYLQKPSTLLLKVGIEGKGLSNDMQSTTPYRRLQNVRPTN